MNQDTCLFLLTTAQNILSQCPGDSHIASLLINVTLEKQTLQAH
jgi:hypothetical protein